VKRIVKKTLEYKKNELSWASSRALATLGDPVSGEGSVSGRIRRLYTGMYKSLDQFDALWYECAYQKRDFDWRTCFLWALILACVINARSAYCEANGNKEPMKIFVRQLIRDMREFVNNNYY
jgi:hypothetical protein